MGLIPFGEVEPLGPPTVGLMIGFSRNMEDERVLQLRMVTSRTTFLHRFQFRSLWGFGSFSLLIRPYTFSSRLWYNVLLLLLVLGLNCQNKPNGFSPCCVLRGGAEIWNFWRLSVYELARNEIFLRHWSSGDWN